MYSSTLKGVCVPITPLLGCNQTPLFLQCSAAAAAARDEMVKDTHHECGDTGLYLICKLHAGSSQQYKYIAKLVASMKPTSEINAYI